MDNSFIEYLQQLELLAFFSGYPLLYAVILFIAGNQPEKNTLKSRMVTHLPYAYALAGTLCLGLQLKSLYPDYSVENIKLTIQQPWLLNWGLLSILFWVPALSKKTVISLIHSLIFFILLIRNIFLQIAASPGDRNMVRNNMKIYTISLFLNLGCLAFILFLSFLFSQYKKSKMVNK